MPGGPAPDEATFRVASGVALRLRAVWRLLADETAARVLAVLGLTEDAVEASVDAAAVAVAATHIAAGSERAVSLADAALALMLTRNRRRPLPLLGLSAGQDLGRLADAVRTALSPEGTVPGAAVSRLARAEPLASGQSAMTDGMSRRGVSGWTRVTGGSPCQVCADLADGSVLPMSVPIWHHPGCSCVAEPATD